MKKEKKQEEKYEPTPIELMCQELGLKYKRTHKKGCSIIVSSKPINNKD